MSALTPCQLARSTCMTMKDAGCGLADMLSKQLHHGRIGRGPHEGCHFPLRWSYRRDTEVSSRTNCRGARGRIPGGAQVRLGMLTRPKRPSSRSHRQHGSLILGAERGKSGLDCLLEVFSQRGLFLGVGFGMNWARHHFAPAMAARASERWWFPPLPAPPVPQTPA